MGFGKQDVEELSARGPGWLSERRREAWGFFEKLELPREKDEPWRYTDLPRLGFELDVFSPVAPPQESQDGPRALDLPEARSGLAVATAGQAAQRALDPSLEARGVILTDLVTALAEHADLLEPRLLADGHSADNIFSALHGALTWGGTFLYVPKGVTVPLPVESVQRIETPGGAAFPHTVVVVGDDAEVVFLEQFASPDGAAMLVNGALDVFAGARARVRVVTLEEHGDHTWHFHAQRTAIGQETTLQSLVVTLGGRFCRSVVETALRGEHGSVAMLGLYFAADGQHFDFRTLQDHVAPASTSDLLYKGALKDHSRTVYSGLIRVNEGASKTDAYQANRNLVLSDEAKADSKPELEILNNDVRCTHGSTVGQIDDEQLFYLQARGIPRHEAERLIVKGFFEDVIGRLSNAELRGLLEEAIERKLGA
jgi:Fe-S cluster assembly protein SufD